MFPLILVTAHLSMAGQCFLSDAFWVPNSAQSPSISWRLPSKHKCYHIYCVVHMQIPSFLSQSRPPVQAIPWHWEEKVCDSRAGDKNLLSSSWLDKCAVGLSLSVWFWGLAPVLQDGLAARKTGFCSHLVLFTGLTRWPRNRLAHPWPRDDN